ncbi:MAG TPA: DUF2334 domain-containing protein [Candidatus Angelobacter sp.]
MSAQYLVRFDDICSTMNWPIWEQIEEALLGAGTKPILAIVPDNQDPKLKAAESNIEFWNRVRVWQARGWSIGLHGYQHLHATRDGGILKLNRWSEFSGLSFEEQRSKLQRARDLLEHEGVHPELWIAPGHSFDANTLRALDEIGIRYLSDGYSLYPYRDSTGMTWVPQQLWHFRRMPFGIWTVCLHLNSWSEADVGRFRSNLQEFGAGLTDWRSVISHYVGRRRSPMDYVFAKAYRAEQWTRVRLRQIRRH